MLGEDIGFNPDEHGIVTMDRTAFLEKLVQLTSSKAASVPDELSPSYWQSQIATVRASGIGRQVIGRTLRLGGEDMRSNYAKWSTVDFLSPQRCLIVGIGMRSVAAYQSAIFLEQNKGLGEEYEFLREAAFTKQGFFDFANSEVEALNRVLDNSSEAAQFRAAVDELCSELYQPDPCFQNMHRILHTTLQDSILIYHNISMKLVEKDEYD